MPLPALEEQIRRTHAGFIREVVAACLDPEQRPRLEGMLGAAGQQGWTDLVAAIRKVVSGERDLPSLANGLDREDSVILRCILEGLVNPDSLPREDTSDSGHLAAPGLAALIDAGRRGDHQAIETLGFLADQMRQAGGVMAQVGAVLRPILDGERDPRVLEARMESTATGLVNSILEELAKLDQH